MQNSSQYRYWAFISYSNQDKKWASWLHRTIETYGIPAQLVRHTTPVGEPAPKRFHPLFHDRAELPAASDLGVEIEDALRASRYLIVVCSRHAAQSRWVNKEIETFHSFGRHQRVLAMIVDGEPNSGGEQECFPPALLAHEPIAADARPEGDGKSGAKVKLLAGMLGVSFDALRQRDAQRRIRRLEFTLAAALLLIFGIGALAWHANQQRIKAIKARQQAERMLEFLVYGMRDDLASVGRLDLVEKVKRRVDEYYKQLGTEASQPVTLHNRASAVNNEGDLLKSQGDLSGALKAYRESLVIAQHLAQSDPTNAEWQRNLSVSHNKVGDVLQAQGDLAGALKAYQESLVIAQRLAQADPTNAVWQRDLAVSHNRVGDILLAQGDLAGALKAYQESLVIAQRLTQSDPTNAGWQRDLAFSHGKIGDILRAQGDLAGALKAHQESLVIRQRLAQAAPTNAGWQRDLASAHCFVGVVLQEQGDLAGALGAYRKYQAGMERLAGSDPTNTGWQRDLSVSHEKVGDALIAQGDLAGALKAYQESLVNRQRLAQSDLTNAGWQRDLWVSYWRIADICEKTGSGEAIAWLRKAYEQLSDMKQRGLFISAADEKFLLHLRRKVEGATDANH